MARTVTVTVSGVALTLTDTGSELPDRDLGARRYQVHAGTVELGCVERVVAESWRTSRRLRTGMRGHTRAWRAQTSSVIADRIATPEQAARPLLGLGLVRLYGGQLALTEGLRGAEVSTRTAALVLIVEAARDAGQLQ